MKAHDTRSVLAPVLAPVAARVAAHVAALGSAGRPVRVAFVLYIMQVAGAEVLVCETIRRLAGLIEPTVLCLDGVGMLSD